MSFVLIGCLLFLSVGASSLPGEEAQAETVLLSAEGRDISRLTLESIPDSLSQTLGLDSAEEQNQAVSLDVADADSLNSFTTIHEDGSRSVYAFAQPVKYWDAETNRIEFIDNDWQEIGLLDSLFSDVAYTNKAGSVKVAMPKDIRSGISVEWSAEGMQNEEDTEASVLSAESAELTEDAALSAKEDYTFRMAPVTDLSARAAQEEGSPYVQYENPFGEGTRLEYKATTNGVKENLVLECDPGVNEFAFDIEAPGLVPNVAQGNTIEFYDEQTGEPAVTLTQPWAMDSAAEQEPADAPSASEEEISAESISEEEEISSESVLSQQQEVLSELAYESETEAAPAVESQPESQEANLCFDLGYRIQPNGEGKYRLVMYIDKEFLEDPATVYPVTIDPSIFTYANDIPYVTLFSDGRRWTNLGCIGNASGAEALMYFKVPNMSQYKHINPNKVVSASVVMTQQVGSEDTYAVDLHDSNTNVSISAATYSTILNNVGTRMTTTYCGVNNTRYVWSFKNLFKAWLTYELTGAGWSSYQFIIKARSTGLDCKYFDTSDTENSFYYVVSYNEDTSVSDGYYYIRGFKEGKYLDHNIAENRTTAWSFDGIPNQRWKVTKNSDGTYSICPADNLDLGLEVYYGEDTNQQPVTQYGYDGTSAYKWRLVSNNDGTYRIMPLISSSRGLDVHNGTDTTMTFHGRSFPKRNGIDVQLYDYTGGSHR